MKYTAKAFIGLLLIGMAALGFSQETWESRITVHELKNGMLFIFYENHDAPIFHAVHGYPVGSVDESTGQTGLAHIVEHMAFKGTKKIGTTDYAAERKIMDEEYRLGAELSREMLKGPEADEKKMEDIKARMAELQKKLAQFSVPNELMSIYQRAGGMNINAGTSNDFTQYTVSLPANRFELWCLVESERMKHPVFREFYAEREVVIQERNQTLANPARYLNEIFVATAFQVHPYRNPVIGWMSDIETVTYEEAWAFKKRFYTPNNCVAVIAGNIDPQTAIPLVEKYFGDIPRGQDPPVVRTREPQQNGERRFVTKSGSLNALRIGFHKPNYLHKDNAALVMTQLILSGGPNSRFRRDLVNDRQLATQIMCLGNIPGIRFDNLFAIHATPADGVALETLEEAIYEHLERLKVEPVEERELRALKNRLEFSDLQGIESTQGMARSLFYNQLLKGDWKRRSEDALSLADVTPEDIMKAAKKHFTWENRTVAYSVVEK